MAENISTKGKTKIVFGTILTVVAIVLIILTCLYVGHSKKLDNLAGNVATDEEVQSLKALADETDEKVESLAKIKNDIDKLSENVANVKVDLSNQAEANKIKLQDKLSDLQKDYTNLIEELDKVVAKEETVNELSDKLSKVHEELNNKIDLAEKSINDNTDTVVEAARKNINKNTTNKVENARTNINTNLINARNKINENTTNKVENARANINTNLINVRNNINENTTNKVENARTNINTNLINARNNINENTTNKVENAKVALSSELAIGFNDLKNKAGENKSLIEEVNRNVGLLSDDLDTYYAEILAKISNVKSSLDSANITLSSISTALTTANNSILNVNNKIDNLTSITNNQTATINGRFNDLNTDLGNIQSNLSNVSAVVGNNVVNALASKIDTLKTEIIGSDSTKTLTYLANQNQNNLSNTKATIQLLGTASDSLTSNTVFGRLNKITDGVESVKASLNTMDGKLDTILSNVTMKTYSSSTRTYMLAFVNEWKVSNPSASDADLAEALVAWLQSKGYIK